MLRKLVCEIVAAGIIMCGFGGQAVFAAGEEVEHVFSPSVTAEQSAATETPEVIDETEVIEDAPLDISQEPPVENSSVNYSEPMETPSIAEETTAAPTAEEELVSSFDVYFTSVLDGWPRKDYGVFNLYDENGAILDSETVYIETVEDFNVHFDFSPVPLGTPLFLEVTGLDSIDYYSDNYRLPSEEKIPLYTYWSEPDEDGVRTPVCDAYMTAHVRTQPPINIYVDGKYTSLSSPAIFEGSYIIAPLSEVAEAIGVYDCTFYPNYNSVKVKTGDNEILVNIGFSYMTVFGQDVNLDLPVMNINSLTYIELRPFVEALGCTLNYADSGEYIDINLNKSPMALEAKAALEERVNQSGVSSSTDYLIWVNKDKFRCAVFEGSKGNWKLLKDFTVGIGASNSETVTGVFQYSDYVSRWPYEYYYVGPVMVFYGNYALHSTLLRYDGTPYNNNVGVKLSLGCVRCQPKYINWMADYVPIGSTVYVTET